MQRGRRIAFDYGDARIGVAVSDPDSILASPLTTLASGDRKLERAIAEILAEYEPVAIYVGKPTNMDGSLGIAVDKSTAFCAMLATISSVPIIEIDERLSTVTAAKGLKQSGVSVKDAKKHIDEMAAVAILEFAIAIEKSQS
ncbi:MAG: Holliday junction resolvase RuvX [Actinobacteria bacterium]|uniref:Unannotated protein n=1 Tax=freshwater metagenome TaxID=449393 RepID=A0A6J7CF40_9ZZZZ|nr:Holliday junction resolvase RuvX [Actinomycetota bacterium]